MLDKTTLPPKSFKEFASWIVTYLGFASDLVGFYRAQWVEKKMVSAIRRFFAMLTERDFAQIASTGELPSERSIELATCSGLSLQDSALPFELYSYALSLDELPRCDCPAYYSSHEVEDIQGEDIDRCYIVLRDPSQCSSIDLPYDSNEAISGWSANSFGGILSFQTDEWAWAVRNYLVDKGRVFDSYAAVVRYAKEHNWPNWEVAETLWVPKTPSGGP